MVNPETDPTLYERPVPVYPLPPQVGSFSQPVPEPRLLTEQDTQRVDELYAQLEPGARDAYVGFIAARTPAEYQEAMKAKVEAGFTPEEPPPPDPLVASVANGATVVVVDSAMAAIPGSPGTALVQDGALVWVQFPA